MMNIEGNHNVNQPKSRYWEKYVNDKEFFPVDDISNLIDTVKKRIKLEMPEVGTFRPIEEKFYNNIPCIYVDDVSLNLKPVSTLNTNKEAILYTNMTNEGGAYHTERTLIQGTRKEILDFINSKDFNHDFKGVMIDCSEGFERSGLA